MSENDNGLHISDITEAMSFPQMAPPDMSRSGMLTPWGEDLNPDRVLQEYPRPQMTRDSYINLNGYWECAFTGAMEEPKNWQKILVPFSPEAPLSGVRRVLKPQETLWYRRMLPPVPTGGHMLLHFGAVDQSAKVYVNDILTASHSGGYTPFTADITKALKTRDNVLVVKVKDDTDASWHSRGKQKLECGGIWYTPQSGIWQTVWLEQVPEQYIQKLRITPLFDEQQLELTVYGNTPEGECEILFGGKSYKAPINAPRIIPAEGLEHWSPEHPRLYDFEVSFGDDRVRSYFAMRKTEVKKDEKGVNRLFLNGRPYFHNGLLDQGYYPDGLYTAPSEQAMRFDIQTAKDMGFNMLRKHVKLEPLRWYYYCDRLGMMVWQDMVNGGRDGSSEVIYDPMITGRHQKDNQYELFGRQDPEGREEYYRELEETVEYLYNTPSVVMWVPFNEGWGQFDAAEAVRRIESMDKTRTIDPASGWNDQGIGQFCSCHLYMKDYQYEKDALERAVILTEYGGYTHKTVGHTFTEKVFGYTTYESGEALLSALSDLMKNQILTAWKQGLSAAVYTQLTDVEGELNGLVTYDRKVLKIPPEAMADLNSMFKNFDNNLK